jgi:micrococcal nuclease
MEFVASTRGRVYYWRGCNGWRALAIANLIYFKTAEEARRAGYQPSTQSGCAGPSSSADALQQSKDTVPPLEGSEECSVSRLVDGDTFDCGENRIRLLLIDTPEMSQQPYGRAALNALLQLLPTGSVVRLEYDIQRNDRYGRVLAYVHSHNGTFVNEAMARSGFAVPLVYPPNIRHVDRIRVAAELAKAERVGLWAEDAFSCTPADYRAKRC